MTVDSGSGNSCSQGRFAPRPSASFSDSNGIRVKDSTPAGEAGAGRAAGSAIPPGASSAASGAGATGTRLISSVPTRPPASVVRRTNWRAFRAPAIRDSCRASFPSASAFVAVKASLSAASTASWKPGQGSSMPDAAARARATSPGWRASPLGATVGDAMSSAGTPSTGSGSTAWKRSKSVWIGSTRSARSVVSSKKAESAITVPTPSKAASSPGIACSGSVSETTRTLDSPAPARRSASAVGGAAASASAASRCSKPKSTPAKTPPSRPTAPSNTLSASAAAPVATPFSPSSADPPTMTKGRRARESSLASRPIRSASMPQRSAVAARSGGASG